MTTVGDWVDARAATAPPHLVTEVRAALGPDAARDAVEAPECCVAAAARLVNALTAREATGRDAALTLLAADALVTFAFEAAAEAPESLQARAVAAMQVLGAPA